MGKLINLIMMLVFIDMMFLFTGQLGMNSPSSIFFQFIENPAAITSTQFYILFVTVMVGTLISGGGVFVGAAISATNVLAFTVASIALATMVGDYISVYTRLFGENPLLATVMFVPIVITFLIVIPEWLRGKD